MSKVSVFGKFNCAEGKEEEMQVALTTMVEASKDIDGVESYSYHKDDGGTYWFFGIMRDSESAQQHGQSESMKEAMASFMPLLAGPPEMGMASMVASYGLDL